MCVCVCACVLCQQPVSVQHHATGGVLAGTRVPVRLAPRWLPARHHRPPPLPLPSSIPSPQPEPFQSLYHHTSHSQPLPLSSGRLLSSPSSLLSVAIRLPPLLSLQLLFSPPSTLLFGTLVNCCCFYNVLHKYIYITLHTFTLHTFTLHSQLCSDLPLLSFYLSFFFSTILSSIPLSPIFPCLLTSTLLSSSLPSLTPSSLPLHS